MTDTLDDALYALAKLPGIPTAESLERIIKQYPEHAQLLTDVALERLDEPFVTADEPLTPEMTERVAKAMSWFEQQRWNLQQVNEESDVINPFDSLTPADYQTVSARADINPVIIIMLRNRQIGPIPDRFVVVMAESMDVEPFDLSRYLELPPRLGAGQFSADGKPEVQEKVDFETAVKSAGLSAEQEAKLLSYL